MRYSQATMRRGAVLANLWRFTFLDYRLLSAQYLRTIAVLPVLYNTTVINDNTCIIYLSVNNTII